MRRWYATVLVVLATAGCGGEGAGDGAASAPSSTPPSTTAPPTTPAGTPTPTANDLRSVLRMAAISEESYFVDTNAYTTDLRKLVEAGLEVPPGVTVKVVSATSSAYCLTATGGGLALYLDSDAGKPTETPCR